MKKYVYPKLFLPALLSAALLFSIFSPCLAQTPSKTLAILPFEVISPDEISYIRIGTLQMLHSRLQWKNHVEVVNPKAVGIYLDNMNVSDPNRTIKKIADLTNSDYVLAGSITQFANAFSIDARIYDIKNKQYLNFFEQSKEIDDVIPKLNVIAAKINKKVFQRETVMYENLIKKEKEKAEQYKRQNPEKLMPTIPGGTPEEKSSIWKFWEYL